MLFDPSSPASPTLRHAESTQTRLQFTNKKRIEPANQTASTGTEPTTTSTAAADTTNTNPDTTASATSATEGSKGPTAEHPSTTGDTGFKAAQADVRDPDTNPTANPQKEEERKNVDDTGSLDQSENPEKVDGAGPKPIEEVARERGGDAGKDGSAAKKDSADPTSTEGGAENDEEDHGESKGTGEQYVKSSGLQADGGDFDATKPGAGREADRKFPGMMLWDEYTHGTVQMLMDTNLTGLLEEKGLANPAAAAAGTKKPEEGTTANSGHGEGEKKSLKEKIKAKLHKN